jgi:hypothetical protein
VNVFDLYSKRRRRALGEVPDIVSYDEFSSNFRTQLGYIIDDAIGNRKQFKGTTASSNAYKAITHILCREYGRSVLPQSSAGYGDEYTHLHLFLQTEREVDHVLDAVELAMRGSTNIRIHDSPEEATREIIDELNTRFNENGLGYQYESEEIIRTDSRLLHEEVVRPALLVVSDPKFEGAEEEFLEAFEHHRHGREKDALTWARKALESTLKIICKARGWADTGQAKDLLTTVFTNGLIEPMWQSEFSALRSVLESGVPTGRNKLGGHGQGSQPISVPGYLAAFVLHQAAAAILFLVEAHKAKP